MGINIYDVASKARVSSATVSRVMNGSPHVRESTKRRVMNAIKELNYTPNAVARKLSTGETGSIGFLVPDIENPFFTHLLRGITDAADRHGYNIFLCSTEDSVEKERRFLESMRAERMSGLLVIPVEASSEQLCRCLFAFQKENVPIVLLDRSLKHGRFDGVFSEDFRGAMTAVECLIREGHRRIATIRGPEDSRPGAERRQGYAAALLKWGIPLEERYIVQGDFHQERAYEAMHTLMEQEEPPTAIFSANNMTSLGCVRYFMEKGLRLGTDISLIGFDDIDLLRWACIPLSVVDRDTYRMGRDAVKLLARRIEDRAQADREEIFIPTELILRGSEKWRGSPDAKL